MKIEKIIENKKQYLDLLLLADESEEMIDKYLEIGDMFALFDDDLKTICVVLGIDKETCELKNIATYEVGKFIQDDYAELGLGAESSRNSFVIYDKIRFDKLDAIGRFNYLSSLEPIYLNPYTGTIISTD